MSAAVVKVSDVCDQIRGVSFSGEDAVPKAQDGYLAVLRANNITEEGLTFDDLTFVPVARISEKQLVRSGDVVIAASSGSLSVVGKAAPALTDLPMGFGAFCKVLRPNQKVVPAYFAHYFKTRDYRKKISSLAAGANINNLRNEHLDDLLFPLPPLEEQRRIATILDQAETLRTQRRQALAHLDTLTQSLFLDMFGDPKLNEKAWHLQTIGALSLEIRGGANLSPDDFLDTGFPVLHKGAIQAGGVLNLDAKKKIFTSPEFAASHRQSVVDNRHVVVTLRDLVPSGPSIGLAVNLATAELTEYLLAQGAYGLLLNPELVVPEYFVRVSAMPSFRPVFKQMAVGSTQIHIRIPVYSAIPIPLPPLALQQTFATRIQAIEALKATHRTALAQLDALFASLQQRAFAGAL